MKSFIKRGLLILLSAVLALALLTGCRSKECEFIGCKEKAMRSGDYCEPHQKTMDALSGIMDGVGDLIGGIFG